MVADERGYMLRNAWPVFAPCLAIVLSVIGVNLLGDGIKEFLVKRGSPRREGGAL
jgi:ABC-type dipeptide/oligopeptide/nickel transport system permease subunit